MEKFLNLLFMPICLFCKSEGSFFCDQCLAKCKKLPLSFIYYPNLRIRHLYIYEYEKIIRECIRSSKYRNRHFASLKVLSEKTFKLDSVQVLLTKFVASTDCLILPIPVSAAKLRKRGFNQAEIIAQKLSNILKIPYSTNVLIRSKETTAQYTNIRSQRFVNLKGAFTVKLFEQIQHKNVILVDDVCTTGATFDEATITVLNAGARQVLCLALAKKSLNSK